MTKSPTYLGRLCPKGHDSGNGQSLRYRSNCGCVECHNNPKLGKKKRDYDYHALIVANRKKALADGVANFLGGLCERNHEYQDSGFSLRSAKFKTCIECKKLRDKSRKSLDKMTLVDAIDERYFLGLLCKREHRHNGLNFSLRRSCNKCCVECSRASAIEYEKNRPPRKHSSYEMEIPPVPKPVDHAKMTTDYDNRIKAIKRLEYQLKKEMAI